MATLSNSSLRGSTDPQVSTQEESTGSEEDIKLSANEVKKTSKEFAELLRVDKSTEVRAPYWHFSLYIACTLRLLVLYRIR